MLHLEIFEGRSCEEHHEHEECRLMQLEHFRLDFGELQGFDLDCVEVKNIVNKVTADKKVEVDITNIE